MGILNRLCVCVTQDCTLKLLWTVVSGWLGYQLSSSVLVCLMASQSLQCQVWLGQEVGKEIKWELGHEYLLWVPKYRGSDFDLFFYPERAHFVGLTFKNTPRLSILKRNSLFVPRHMHW